MLTVLGECLVEAVLGEDPGLDEHLAEPWSGRDRARLAHSIQIDRCGPDLMARAGQPRTAPGRAADWSVDPADRQQVTEALGREPMGRFRVAVRGRDGVVSVIENRPVLDDGTPMPTMYWLVDPHARRLVGRLEAAGGVARAEAEVSPRLLARAHERYATERDRLLEPGQAGAVPVGGVGGTRRGVKCLHAHYAWYLAGGDDPVGRWVDEHLSEVTP